MVASRSRALTIIAIALGVAIMIASAWGALVGVQIPSDPGCMEVCGLANVFVVGFAAVFGTSALINFILLVTTVATRSGPSLLPVVITESVLLGCALLWVLGLLIRSNPLGFLAGAAVAAMSIVVCVVIALARRRLAPGVASG